MFAILLEKWSLWVLLGVGFLGLLLVSWIITWEIFEYLVVPVETSIDPGSQSNGVIFQCLGDGDFLRTMNGVTSREEGLTNTWNGYKYVEQGPCAGEKRPTVPFLTSTAVVWALLGYLLFYLFHLFKTLRKTVNR